MSKYHLKIQKCKNNEFEKFRRSGVLKGISFLSHTLLEGPLLYFDSHVSSSKPPPPPQKKTKTSEYEHAFRSLHENALKLIADTDFSQLTVSTSANSLKDHAAIY